MKMCRSGRHISRFRRSCAHKNQYRQRAPLLRRRSFLVLSQTVCFSHVRGSIGDCALCICHHLFRLVLCIVQRRFCAVKDIRCRSGLAVHVIAFIERMLLLACFRFDRRDDCLCAAVCCFRTVTFMRAAACQQQSAACRSKQNCLCMLHIRIAFLSGRSLCQTARCKTCCMLKTCCALHRASIACPRTSCFTHGNCRKIANLRKNHPESDLPDRFRDVLFRYICRSAVLPPVAARNASGERKICVPSLPPLTMISS